MNKILIPLFWIICKWHYAASLSLNVLKNVGTPINHLHQVFAGCQGTSAFVTSIIQLTTLSHISCVCVHTTSNHVSWINETVICQDCHESDKALAAC